MAPQTRDDYRTLTGAEKAAILMLSLGEDHSVRLFALMDEEEIKELSQTMANLGNISSSVVERLFVDFADQISATGSLVGSHESTERLLQKVLGPDRVSAIMEEIRGPAGRTMWDKLGNVNETVLANYLKNEYPQTVAVVLSKIKADHAGRVLTQLPENFAMEVVNDGERTLGTEFFTNLARSNRRDAHELIAEIFNSVARATETKFLTALEERNRDSAERVKSLMFTFDDLGKLDSIAMQTVLRNAEKEKLPIALKGASDTMKDLFFSNMSERAGKLLKEEMSSMGPVRLKDVEESQSYLVSVAKDLAARGEIVISDGNAEDELVY